MNPDGKNQLYTIVYTVQLTNDHLYGVKNPYSVSSTEPEVEPEIDTFTEANDVIARIKAGL